MQAASPSTPVVARVALSPKGAAAFFAGRHPTTPRRSAREHDGRPFQPGAGSGVGARGEGKATALRVRVAHNRASERKEITGLKPGRAGVACCESPLNALVEYRSVA